MVRSSAAILLFLLAAEAPPPLPPAHHAAPARAADHVAEMVLGEGLEPRDQGRSRLIRHGRWLREDRVIEGRANFVHSDFTTGTSFTYTRDAEGRYSSVWISRIASTATRQRFQRTRTGRRARALGESCEIWNAREVGQPEGEGLNALSCDTADGITLWTRTESARYGTVFRNSRTLSFTRRPVAAGDAAPPRDLLRLDFWRARAPPWAAARNDHRVEFASRSEAGGRFERRILQRHGDWLSTDRWKADGSRQLSIHTPATGFSYEQEANGRPVMLQVQTASPDQLMVGESAWLPMTDRPAERVLGETCHWVRSGMFTHDAFYAECRAADGVPLRIEERGRGGGTLLTATSVSRRPLPPAAFAPPAAAVSWAAWRVPGRPRT